MTDNAFISGRPSFKLAGETRADLEQALTGMVVNLPLHGCAHAELQLTNWGVPEGGQNPDFIFDEIALGTELEIEMGPDSIRLFKGEVTGIEERYGEGAPNLILLLQDKLHRLALTRHSRCFEDQSPDELVQAIAAEAGLQSDVNLSRLTADWHQLNESDLAFLLRLTARFDIALRLQNDATLRVKAEESDPSPVALDAQDSALQVRLIADLNHQSNQSGVNGYNLATDNSVDHSAESMIPAPGGTSATETLEQLSWGGEEIVPQPFARSSAEAEAYAMAHFRRQAKRFISGDIVCQGEPELTCGKEIELTGVSPRLLGCYQIVHCTHRFDNQTGYETHLKVNRGGWQV